MSDPTGAVEAGSTEGVAVETTVVKGPHLPRRKAGPPPEGAGIALAVAIIATAVLSALGFLLAFVGFGFLATYAVVKAVSDHGSGNPLTVTLGFVIIVALFATLLGVAMGLLGRSLSPKKRRRD
jgi:multisubunit Na+/H+ antiporter MnhB subunit